MVVEGEREHLVGRAAKGTCGAREKCLAWDRGWDSEQGTGISASSTW
jgi:hypothetical protein